MEAIREDLPPSIESHREKSELKRRYQMYHDDITNNGVILNYSDRHALAELALTSLEMDALRHDLSTNGEYLEVQGDRNMVTKKNPSRDALEKIRPRFLAMLKEFKMTPGARGFKPAEIILDKDPEFDNF